MSWRMTSRLEGSVGRDVRLRGLASTGLERARAGFAAARAPPPRRGFNR